MMTAFLLWPAQGFAQKISVKSATPGSGPQGATGLNVTVAGSGFSPGDRVDFFRSGTTDPAGLKVNKTTYVTNTQLVANIDISDGAAVAYFDVQVTSSSRSGKGTDLFSVTLKSQVWTSFRQRIQRISSWLARSTAAHRAVRCIRIT